MKSRWIINILLFLAIVTLSLIAYYKPGVEELPNNNVTKLKPEEITRIVIKSRLTEGVVLFKERGEWLIKADKPVPADATRVAPLTKLASQVITRDYLADQLDMEKIGLSPSRGSVILNDTEISFGGIDALESLRYIQTGKRIALIPDNYQHMINADLVYFASPRIVRENQKVQSIQLPGLTVTYANNKWLTVPSMLENSDVIPQFITSWENASAINIEPYEQNSKPEKIILYLREPVEVVRLDIIESENTLTIGRADLGIQYKLGGRQNELLNLVDPDAVDPGEAEQ